MIRSLDFNDFENGFSNILMQKFKTSISKEEFQIRLNETQTKSSGYFVLEINNTVVGYVKYILELKFSPDKKYVGHIEDVFVIESSRNNGNGYALVKHCLEFLKNEDCYKIILNCQSHLLPFYKKFGFEETGHLMDIRLLK